MIQIKNRYDGSVIHESEKETLREAVLEAIEKKVNLRSANLRSADLTYADLTYADLTYADLTYADLRSADLTYADLTYADLTYADLRSADLRYAKLAAFKNDIFEVLLNAPGEVCAVLELLNAGKINGSCYEPRSGCCCLVGSIATARGLVYSDIDDVELPGITPDGSRPAEMWFANIRPGHTPENSQVAAITRDWIEEFQTKIAAFVAIAEGKTPVQEQPVDATE